MYLTHAFLAILANVAVRAMNNLRVVMPLMVGQRLLGAQARWAPRNQREVALIGEFCAPCLLDVGAVRRGWSVNPAIRLLRVEWNKLNGNG